MPDDQDIQNPPTKTRALYDAVSKEYNVGTYEEFDRKLQDPKKRKAFYGGVGSQYNLGSYDEFEQKLGYSGKKKEDTVGSTYPSGSSPNQTKTEQSVNTSASVLQKNYKNNSITPSDVAPTGPQDAKNWKGLTPEAVSTSINNKGINLSNWSNSSTDTYISSLVRQHQSTQKQIEQMTGPGVARFEAQQGSFDQYETQLKTLKDQESYLRGEITKNYEARKKKILPDVLSDIQSSLGGKDWVYIYGMDFKSKLQWSPVTNKLTPQSVEWVAGKVDDFLNKRKDVAMNAQSTGDLEDKKRTYADMTKSVVDELNFIPVKKAQDDFTKEYAEKNPLFKEAIGANKKVNDYFSKDRVDDIKSKVNVNRDKELIKTGQKYYGEGGIFQQNTDFINIQHKYAQLVSEKKMSDSVARSQIQAEIKQNPALKKINENLETEIKKIHERTQHEFQNYIIEGLKKDQPALTVYKDGSVGLSGMSEDAYKKMMEGYEKGLKDIASKMGAESEASFQKEANEKAKSVGAFWGSVGSSINDLTGAFSKFIFNKTQWGAKNVQYYEAQEIASPQIEQSQIAASWNWKGIESLKDPNFWLSKTGSMVPVIAGAGAIGLATDGSGLPEYVGWLANAGLFTAQSGLSTYNQLLNTRDAQGNLLTESDASHYMAEQMEKDFLPNLLMMVATSGTIFRSKNIAKPTILGTVKKGLIGAAEAQPSFTWTGYNDYAISQEAQGKKTDFWDYMQSKEFKDNLINGMVIGGGLSLLHAPGAYIKSVDNWTKMVHSSEREFLNLIPQNYALAQEAAGNGNYLRDALKFHIFNADPESLTEEGKKTLSDLKNVLLYSTNLDRNIRQGHLDVNNINDLYQAHNLALADQHDYLSEQASKEGNKSLSDIYKDKAKDYREQAKAASNDQAKYHYLINEQDNPIFLSNQSFKVLGKEGTIGKWMQDGTIKSVHDNTDPEFAQRYKEFVEVKSEAAVEGSDIMDHAKSLIEENKDKLGVYYAVAKENPEVFYKEVANQVFGRNADGSISEQPNAEKAARDQYGDDIVHMSKLLYPITKKEGGSDAKEVRGDSKQLSQTGETGARVQADSGGDLQQGAETGAEAGDEKDKIAPKGSEDKTEPLPEEYKPQIRDDYFARSDFFTPEEKEKFLTMDEAGQDKMIDDKRAELKAQSETTITSPKTSTDGEKTKEAERRERDVLTPIEGEPKQHSVKDEEPPPPTSPPIREPEESPKEEFVSVRKEKNAEIEGAKELFKNQKVVKWNDTYLNALSNVHSMYPDKNLYEALKARVGHFTNLLEHKILFNPTSEDNAVFNTFKLETLRRMANVQGFDSSDPIHQLAAQAEFASLQKDLLDVARVTNPEGEAGRAFNILQSEIANDLENGLQIRRMEIAAAKGSKLTDAELEETAATWHKEQELLQKEHELKLKAQQERFEKEIDRLKRQLKEGKDDGKEPTVKQKREKLLSERGKELADKIRGGKLKGTYATFPGIPQAINVVLEGIAKLVEAGSTLAEAIGKYVKDNGIKDEEKFTNDLFSVFSKQEKKENAYDQIEKEAFVKSSTDITNSMVAKNLIRDYINSHVGLHDNIEVLDVAYKQLKNILPDLTKDRLREAYLKEGDFKQPTKKQVESDFKRAQNNFTKLTSLEKDINDLQEKKNLFKRNNNKGTTPFDKDIAAKEREKKDIMTQMGIKTSSEDKYTKASYDQRAKSHNERLENISKGIEEKLSKGNLPPDVEKYLRSLKGKLDASKIVLDPISALSQERTLKGGNDLLKSIASEFRRNTIGDISKVGDINRELQRAVDKFASDKDESEQDIKLQRAKDQARNQKDEYARKLAAGEFEDKPIVQLTKYDAERIKLERDRNKIRQDFEDKRREYEKKNAPLKKRVFGFLRAAEVASLIWRPMTLLRVGASAALRPNLEAATKSTLGKAIASLPFETTKALTEQAKKGGESSSNRAISKLYESQFKQYGPEKIKEIYDKASDKFEKLDKEYQQAKDTMPEKELKELKDKRDHALIDAVYTSVYQFIGGSSLKEGLEVLLHRSTELERQLGQFDYESFEKYKEGATTKEKFATSLDNINHVMNFVGRSHAALKNFSARASFASGFMARLEGYMADGIDITKPEKLLEIAHESYIDWERGKYQESNWSTDTWNKATNAVERVSPELAFLMRADVAITRVPVNLLREGIMEYTLGAFRGSVMAAREYYKAKGIVLADGYTPENEVQFKKELQEQLNKIDPDKAATIIRAFRKGGFGLGLYALALIGKVSFGGWAHKGMTAEDKKKLEREQETGIPEIKTSQIKIGDYTLPDWASKVVEHTPAFAPLGFGLGLSQVYENNIIDGRTTADAATNAIMGQVNHITNTIPQLDKVVLPLGGGITKSVLPSGQWDDVDIDGNPMKRKAFEIWDYFKYLNLFNDVGVGSKKGILSENYYKQAVSIQRSFRQQITDVEINTSLSKKEKEEQREQLLSDLKDAIDEVYKQNKENPQ